LKSIEHNYPNILKWARRIYQKPGGKLLNILLLYDYLSYCIVKETVNMEHIKGHYYMSHRQINPTQVVPVGNGPDLDAPIDE
jgi:putative glutathione S-transferase